MKPAKPKRPRGRPAGSTGMTETRAVVVTPKNAARLDAGETVIGKMRAGDVLEATLTRRGGDSGGTE